MKTSWATRAEPSEPLRITLADDFENKDTVRKVLDLATGRKPLRPFPSDDIDDWRNIYLFAQKWDCPQIIYTLRLYLTGLATSDSSSCDEVFVLSAIMDDPALCALAIRSAGSDVWKTRPKKDLGTICGMSIIDPTGWNAEHFMLTPPVYIWALMRAMQEEEGKGERADRFADLIRKHKDSLSET